MFYLLFLLSVGVFFTLHKAVIPMRRTLFDHQPWSVWPGLCAAILIHAVGMAAGHFSENRPMVWLVYIGVEGAILMALLFYCRFFIKQPFSILGLFSNQLSLQMIMGLRWIIGYFIIGNLSFYLLSIILLKILKWPHIFDNVVLRAQESMRGSWVLLTLVETEWGAAYLWIPVLFLVLVGPFLEELVFRGLLYGPMRRTVGPVIASLLSAFLFMLGHGQIAQGTFVFGLLFSYLYESTQSLVPSILFHLLINLRSVEGYFAPIASPSPEVLLTQSGWRVLFFTFMFLIVSLLHLKMRKKGIHLQVPVGA